MNALLMPPKNTVEKIAYLSVLPMYYPEILNDYAKVNPQYSIQIWEILCKEINHLNESYQKWVNFYKDDTGWTEHLRNCGYKTP